MSFLQLTDSLCFSTARKSLYLDFLHLQSRRTVTWLWFWGFTVFISTQIQPEKHSRLLSTYPMETTLSNKFLDRGTFTCILQMSESWTLPFRSLLMSFGSSWCFLACPAVWQCCKQWLASWLWIGWFCFLTCVPSLKIFWGTKGLTDHRELSILSILFLSWILSACRLLNPETRDLSPLKVWMSALPTLSEPHCTLSLTWDTASESYLSKSNQHPNTFRTGSCLCSTVWTSFMPASMALLILWIDVTWCRIRAKKKFASFSSGWSLSEILQNEKISEIPSSFLHWGFA